MSDGPLAALAWGLAAGVAMLADTLVPQACEDGRDLAGLATAAGFLLVFVLHKAGA